MTQSGRRTACVSERGGCGALTECHTSFRLVFSALRDRDRQSGSEARHPVARQGSGRIPAAASHATGGAGCSAAGTPPPAAASRSASAAPRRRRACDTATPRWRATETLLRSDASTLERRTEEASDREVSQCGRSSCAPGSSTMASRGAATARTAAPSSPSATTPSPASLCPGTTAGSEDVQRARTARKTPRFARRMHLSPQHALGRACVEVPTWTPRREFYRSCACASSSESTNTASSRT